MGEVFDQSIGNLVELKLSNPEGIREFVRWRHIEKLPHHQLFTQRVIFADDL